MRVLALNAGSSSLKASLVDGDRSKSITLDWRAGNRQAALDRALGELSVRQGSVEGVAHRIVHGGSQLTAPVLVDEAVIDAIDTVSELAPLHNDVALETLRSARTSLPDVAHVACFDTAFHATLPELWARYPVPLDWQRRWAIRRYGFHGLSVEWSVIRAGQLLGRDPADLGLVIAHLGSGCSVTAVSGGRSVWTSMGFTPLEGLMMRTRSGSIDPGILLHLIARRGVGVAALEHALEHESGLAAIGGRAGDVRELEAARSAGDGDAALALDMFAARVAEGIAGAATSLERLDAIVFTGGVGEHAARLRAAIVGRLRVLRFPAVDPTETGTDRVLAREPIAILRVEAREDLVMARAAERLLASPRT